MKLFRSLLAGAFAILASTAVQAADKMKSEVALNGHCPVCYIAAGKAVKGTDSFKTSHEGQTYLFVSQDALDAFNKEPAKFLPAYGGNCAICMAKGNTVSVTGETFFVHEGRIFLNKSAKLETMFKDNLAENIKAADKNWKTAMMAKAEMMKDKK